MNGNNSTTRLDKHVRDAYDQDTNSANVNESSLFARPFEIETISLFRSFLSYHTK